MDYKVGSIAALLAAEGIAKKKQKGEKIPSSTEELYDPKLVEYFKQTDPLPKSAFSFTAYEPIVLPKSKQDSKSEVKLRNKDAAEIRIEARSKNKNKKGKSIDNDVEVDEVKVKVKDVAEPVKKKKRKKIKIDDDNSSVESEPEQNLDLPKKKRKKAKAESDSDEDEEKDDKEATVAKKTNFELNRPKEKDEERESRTVFIGNVPTACKKKEILKLFRDFGKIETVRFRGATPAKPNALKKIALRKNNLHPDRTSLVAFVRFETREEAENVVEKMNGTKFKDHHLSLDLADKKAAKAKDNKKAVFIGNLHMKTEDDELWDLFKDCGSISSVRIIRDPTTGMAKGFGYVNFETTDSVELALKKDEALELRNRSIRISRCVKKSKHANPNPNPDGQKVKSEIKVENSAFVGDRLAEIGKLKRKSKNINLGERKKASVARQLAGQSRPRPPKKNKKSQGMRQRPGGPGPGPAAKGQGYGSKRPEKKNQGQGSSDKKSQSKLRPDKKNKFEGQRPNRPQKKNKGSNSNKFKNSKNNRYFAKPNK